MRFVWFVLAVSLVVRPARADDQGPLATTRAVLERSHAIVVAEGDRNHKLEQLKGLLRSFLDTDTLGRSAMGKHLDGHSSGEVKAFLDLFRELFLRTYVQRLLLFDAPEFAFGKETIDGGTATVATEIVTEHDRFAVDYRLAKAAGGWRATDILVEEVSLGGNFRSQFDAALATDSFAELLDRLRRKVAGKPNVAGF